MGLVLSWAGMLGVVASLAALVLAVVVFGTRPGRSQNRRLGLMLFVEGLSFLGGTGMMYLTDSVASSWAWQAVTICFLLATPFAYLLFLATLDTPLAAPLRAPLVEKGLMLGLVLAPAAWFLSPSTFVEAMQPGRFAPWDAVLGIGFLWVLMGVVLTSILGLVLAISTWRRASERTVRRSQARSYALAFGARDAGFPATFILVMLTEAGVVGATARFAAAVVLPATVLLLFVLLLAYGILKTQLFDIDLKIKWGIRRSTVAAVFVAAFFVAGELAETFLGELLGTYAGIFAAGVLVFFLAPLQRFADKVGDMAMPGVEDTEEYRMRQKLAIYRASLEELLVDGEITPKERRMLGRLQEELGIQGGPASRIEADVLEAGAEAL